LLGVELLKNKKVGSARRIPRSGKNVYRIEQYEYKREVK
jgi:hypothetical protein